MSMDRKLRDKWLKALRSGKFRQAQGRLRRVDRKTGEESFCCLGVLGTCSGASKETLRSKEMYGNSCGLNNNQTRKLSTMNDTGQSFEQISNWIERNV